MLAPVILTLNHDPRWLVGNAHGGIGPVNVLTTSPRSTIGVDPQILVDDVDFNAVINHRAHPNRRKRRMAAALAVIGRNPNKPVHASFGLQPAKGILAFDLQSRRLDAGFFTVGFFQNLKAIAVCRSPARIEP